MRRTFFTPVLVAVMGVTAALILPAVAQAATGPSTDTTTTFDVNGGLLTITTPDTAALGTVPIGAPTVSAALGSVIVDDERGTLGGSWTASVISTDFTTGGAAPAETVPAASVAYAPGAATATTGTGTFTPGPGGAMDTSQTAFSATATTGVTTVHWDPTITVTLRAGIVAGTYTGTITHSVA